MPRHRVSPSRRPGRPLSGAEPLDARLTVMVTAAMLRQIEARSGGRVPEFVRAVLGRATGARSTRARGGSAGQRGRGTGIRRYGR